MYFQRVGWIRDIEVLELEANFDPLGSEGRLKHFQTQTVTHWTYQDTFLEILFGLRGHVLYVFSNRKVDDNL